jgi:hypothetical protein
MWGAPAAAVGFLLAAATGGAVWAQRAEMRDVPWYQARPQVLEETLRRCHRDARLMETYDCQNAEAAAASRLGQTQSRPPARSPAPKDSSGLPEPDFNPRTNPFGYDALKRACAERGPGSSMYLPYCGQLDRYGGGGKNGR